MEYYFIVAFPFVFALILYINWIFVKKWWQLIIRFMPKPDAVTEYLDDNQERTLGSEFDQIVKDLEELRVSSKKKTKGLFRRALMKTWFVLAFCFLMLLGPDKEELTGEVEFNPDDIIFPLLISLFLSLIGAGIYFLIKKVQNKEKFTRVFKNELVAKLVSYINPNLTFFDRGIELEDFQKAELFRGASLESEDTIQGEIDGQEVIVSECVNIKTLHASHENRLEIFRGLFIQFSLKDINIKHGVKIIPKQQSEDNENVLARPSRYKRCFLNKEHLYNPEIGNEKIDFYCKDVEDASKVLNDRSLKIIDYIFSKYNYQDVFLSFQENMLYVAIDWNQDLFETDMLLSNNLVQSGIAKKIHEELLFVNQIITEVSLINKI
ncbi:MAG: DUF3137 domain-containing protein [Reichenbachiella sp.]